jgi:hypothetical protein
VEEEEEEEEEEEGRWDKQRGERCQVTAQASGCCS